MPALLRTIIGDLLVRETDIVITGKSVRHEDCLREARNEHAEIVITQDLQQGGSTCLDLILAEPPLGVLAVAPDGHSAAGVSFARESITLDRGSPAILADAIRRMAAELSARSVERPEHGISATGSET
jgi:hypothetical protein